MSGDAHAIAEAHIMLENYDELEDLINGLPDNDEILPTLADKFRLMGLCQSATTAYLKCGKTNKALECCIELNEWSQAKIISSRFGLGDVDKMIIQKANELLNDNCLLLAVQLYKRAGYYIEAAKLLNEVAKMASSQKLSLIKIKKLYVMSGLMVEEYRNYVKNNTTLSDKVASTLRGYLVEGSSVDDVSVLDKAWHGAEAYHLIMLAHRYLYDGDFEKAMKLGMILQSYTDILDPVVVYSLLCVSAVNCHTLSIASLAMMRLEMLPTLSQEKKEEYEELSVQMFKLHPPRDKCHPLICPRCESPFDTWKNRCDSCNGDVTICMSTGDIILVEASWMCPSCRHKTHASIGSNILSYCPLCHANIN
jgi:WD repeat-containing protein 35